MMSRIDPVNLPLPVTFSPSESYTKQAPLFLPPDSPTIDLVSKPDLAHPDSFKTPTRSIFSIVSNFLDRTQSIERIYVEMLEREMDHTHESVSTNLEAHTKHQDLIEKEQTSSDFWDYLRKIAIYVVGAASIVLGITMVAPAASIAAAVAGGAMILSGGASILGNILYDLHVHPKVATALMVTGGALGVIGGISSTVLGIGSLTEVLGRVVTAAFSCASSSAEIMKNSHKWKLADLQASHTSIQKASEINRERYRSMEKDLTLFGETIAKSTEVCIAAQEQHQSIIKKITTLSGPLTAA